MSDQEDDKPSEGSEKPWWSEAIKDLTSASLATIFMTEESVRGYLREKKLPKEMVGLLLDNMGKRKDDVYKVVGKEIGAFLSKVDLSKEVGRFLETHRVSIEGKISFEAKEAKPKKEDK
jgi:predicted KAP-like P-loop ATPase